MIQDFDFGPPAKQDEAPVQDEPPAVHSLSRFHATTKTEPIKTKLMQIDPEQYARIADEIHSDSSPVGIDAKKTHILILDMLIKLDERMQKLERQLADLQPTPPSKRQSD